MNLNAYPKFQYRIRNRLEAEFFISAFLGDYNSSMVSKLSLFDFYHTTHWTPHDVHATDVLILCKQMKGFSSMVTKSQFVMNNLTDEQLSILDSTYPGADVIDDRLNHLISNCFVTFALQLDKSGSYICYGNQNKYAVSGRSSSALDAVVIVLFKFHLAGDDLSTKATNTSAPSRRG